MWAHDDTGAARKAAFTYHALGRRIEQVNDVTGDTVRYYYDVVNPMTARPSRAGEIVELRGGGLSTHPPSEEVGQ